MEMQFSFLGIHTSLDGSHPRARVSICFGGADWPAETAFQPKLTIDLPISAMTGSLSEIEQAALQAAQQSVQSAGVENWLRQQGLPA